MTNKYRTKEQIAKDDLLFSTCYVCGDKLRASKQPRVSAKKCAECKGWSKEAIPIIQTQKSIISRIFSRLFA